MVYLKPVEVADRLGINLSTVYTLLRAGDLPALRVGRSWRIPEAEFLAALEAKRNTYKEGSK